MNLSPEMVVAASAIVTSIGTAVAAILTARGNARRIIKVDDKMNSVVATGEAIHTAVNSTATAQQAKIDALLARVEDMMSSASEKAKIAALLAAIPAPVLAPPPQPVVTPAVDTPVGGVVPAQESTSITPKKRRRRSRK